MEPVRIIHTTKSSFTCIFVVVVAIASYSSAIVAAAATAVAALPVIVSIETDTNCTHDFIIAYTTAYRRQAESTYHIDVVLSEIQNGWTRRVHPYGQGLKQGGLVNGLS